MKKAEWTKPIAIEDFFNPEIPIATVMKKYDMDEPDVRYCVEKYFLINSYPNFGELDEDRRDKVIDCIIIDLRDTRLPIRTIADRYRVYKGMVSGICTHKFYEEKTEGIEFPKRKYKKKAICEFEGTDIEQKKVPENSQKEKVKEEKKIPNIDRDDVNRIFDDFEDDTVISPCWGSDPHKPSDQLNSHFCFDLDDPLEESLAKVNGPMGVEEAFQELLKGVGDFNIDDLEDFHLIDDPDDEITKVLKMLHKIYRELKNITKELKAIRKKMSK